MLKNLAVDFGIPVFLYVNDKRHLVGSAVLSTVAVCIVTTFVPQLMPVWMAMATRTPVQEFYLAPVV